MNNIIHNRKYLKEFRRELRNNPTKAKTKLWQGLRKSQIEDLEDSKVLRILS